MCVCWLASVLCFVFFIRYVIVSRVPIWLRRKTIINIVVVESMHWTVCAAHLIENQVCSVCMWLWWPHGGGIGANLQFDAFAIYFTSRGTACVCVLRSAWFRRVYHSSVRLFRIEGNNWMWKKNKLRFCPLHRLLRPTPRSRLYQNNR